MPGLWRAGACKRLIVSVPTAPLIPPLPAEDALPPLSHFRACAACRSIRLRRGSAVRSSPPAARCLGAAARRPRGGDGRVERRRGGRLFEAVGMIDSNMTKMDFPFSAFDTGVIPHHSGHVYGPLEVCEQPGR
jgi:hypothetical protein